MINVEKDKSERSLLNISISSNDPLFSKNLLNSTIEKLQELVVELKLSLAQEKKDFIADRIFDIKTDLTKAEERLKNFREKNRAILDSPTLLLKMERLSREVAALQQIFVTLRSESELAEIEIIEKGSRIQILDEPEIPLTQTSPRYMYSSAIASLLSLIILSLIIIVRPVFKKNMYLFYLFYNSDDL